MTKFVEKHPYMTNIILGVMLFFFVVIGMYNFVFKPKEEHFTPLIVHSVEIQPYQLESDRTFIATFELSVVRTDCTTNVDRILIDETGKYYSKRVDFNNLLAARMDRKRIERAVKIEEDLKGEISFLQVFSAKCPEKIYVIPSPVQQFKMPG